jgi:hypothetical protein
MRIRNRIVMSVLTVFLNCPYLRLHLLKTVFRQPCGEHLVEPLNFLYSDTTAANVFVTAGTPTVKAFISMVTFCSVHVST